MAQNYSFTKINNVIKSTLLIVKNILFCVLILLSHFKEALKREYINHIIHEKISSHTRLASKL